MSEQADPNGAARWARTRSEQEHASSARDPDLMRKRADRRAALAVDGQAAMAEYEAHRRAVRANTARLAALRRARDAKLIKAQKK